MLPLEAFFTGKSIIVREEAPLLQLFLGIVIEEKRLPKFGECSEFRLELSDDCLNGIPSLEGLSDLGCSHDIVEITFVKEKIIGIKVPYRSDDA